MRKTEERKNHTEIWEEEEKKPMGLSVLGKPNLGGIKSIIIVILFAGVAVLGLFLNIAGSQQEKLSQQLASQTEQLDRQQLLIDELRKNLTDQESHKPVPIVTSDTILHQLNSLQELVTQEYIYTNSDRSQSYAKWIFDWKRPFSDTSILVTYDGRIKAGIEFDKIQVDVNEESRTITVTLPASVVLDNNIPQETIQVLDVQNGLFNSVTFDDYNGFIADQKIIMKQKAIDQGLLEKADAEARKTIETFLSLMPEINTEDGYKLIVN